MATTNLQVFEKTRLCSGIKFTKYESKPMLKKERMGIPEEASLTYGLQSLSFQTFFLFENSCTLFSLTLLNRTDGLALL